MRIKKTQGGLTVQAVVGDHAAFLGFGLTPDARKGCLGFALHRVDHTENESYWLPGFKTFRSVVPNPTSTVIYPSNQHPVQSMWWGDYSAKPTHNYTYKIVPVYGTPAAPVADDATSVSLDVATGDPDSGVHGIYFNRGVAASQAYATKFGKKPSDLPPDKQAEAMTWLSRGLHEALLAFITADASPELVLRAAAYEFTEPSVLAAFAQAKRAGADVQIIYHDNRAIIKAPSTRRPSPTPTSTPPSSSRGTTPLSPTTNSSSAPSEQPMAPWPGSRCGPGRPT